MSDTLFAVVMAGGGGTRLWPVSRRRRPKQSLRLLGDETLFQATISRLLPLIPLERILVVTVAEQAELLASQVPDLGEGNFLIEPAPRGTASVIGLAAIELIRRDPGAVMACLPADHIIQEDQRLRDALSAAEVLADSDHLVTLGLEPARPDTGYGYIEKGEPLDMAGDFAAFGVRSFKEKPDADLANAYVASGQYLWNAGIFVWKAVTIRRAVDRWMPDLGETLAQIEGAAGDVRETVERVWPGLESETVDYGVMEKADHVATLEVAGLGWLDVGSWDKLFDVLPKDADGNVVIGDLVSMLESSGSLVYRYDKQDASRLVALVGVENVIVIDAGDAILVTSRAQAQKVRELVKVIESVQGERYL